MKRTEFPSLDDLRAFDAVARLGSMRKAADEQALTHGAISRRVSKLSTDLSIELFEKEGRGVRLSEAGRVLAHATQEAFQTLTTALLRLRQTDATRPIVLSCERSIAMRWLIPRLNLFQVRHPDIPIHLSVGGGAIDFEREGVSLALRRIDFPVQPQWRLEYLIDEEMGPTMVPDMEPMFRTGRYLALGAKTRPDAWHAWLASHKTITPPYEIRYFDHHSLMAEAAASGLGVAMCPRILAIDDLGRNRIVAPCGFERDGSRYALVFPESSQANEQNKIFRTWLFKAIQQT